MPSPPRRIWQDHCDRRLGAAEAALRVAGRLLEYAGVTDAESARLAGVAFRLAQRVAVDTGRLERAA